MPYISNNPKRSLGLIKEYAFVAKDKGAKLICFPECFLQGYELNENTHKLGIELSSDNFHDILNQLKDIKSVVIFGLIEEYQGRTFNTAVVINEGKLLGKYRKVNLIGKEKEIFEAGDEYPVFNIENLSFGVNICYDTNFPESAKALSDKGAELIFCPCNNLLTHQNAEKWKDKHNPIRAERATETGTWLVSSDVTGKTNDRIGYGPTAVISPDGGVVEQLPLMKSGILTYEIVI